MTEFDKESLKVSGRGSRKIPRSFKELTPTKAFNPATFFYEMVWKAFLTKRSGEHKKPDFPTIDNDELALTWIGHASFLIQFRDMNAMVDPNFANWLFWQKRVRKAGLKLQDVPPLDLVMITHAHFDHFHKASLRKLPTRIAVVPWGVGDLVKGLGFEKVIELEWWESYSHGDWKVTFTPSKHWGARVIHDDHRGFGGYVLEHSGRRIYHAVTAPISMDSRRSERDVNLRSHSSPSEPTSRTHSDGSTWGRMKRCRSSRTSKPRGWSPCITVPSNSRSKTWMNLHAGWVNWRKNRG